MDYPDLIYEIAAGVAVITLNRPARLNAFTIEMDHELHEALQQADRDDSVRAIIITGAGRAFSAGADVAVLEQVRGQAAATTGSGLITTLRNEGHSFSDMLALRKPVIAAINGPCAGMAFIIAAYSDIRVAAQSARMGLVFTRRGLTPEDGINWILPRLVGAGMALELQITGRFVDAREALAIGLVNHLVPDGQALDKAREIALDIAAQLLTGRRDGKQASRVRGARVRPSNSGGKIRRSHRPHVCKRRLQGRHRSVRRAPAPALHRPLARLGLRNKLAEV